MRTIIITALLSVLVFSCKKDKEPEEDPSKGFTEDIKNIIPDTTIAKLRSFGVIMHEGKTPPNIEGIYRISKKILFKSSIVGDNVSNFADYYFKVFEQKSNNQIARYSFKQGSNKGVSDKIFISGNDKKFSIFSETNSSSSSAAEYVTLEIISAELNENGTLKDCQYTLYVKSKVDPHNTLIPVGSTRTFIDEDGTTDTVDEELFNSLRMNTSLKSATSL